jgi:hypothetical protein
MGVYSPAGGERNGEVSEEINRNDWGVGRRKK